jgi:hypothetical protein
MVTPRERIFSHFDEAAYLAGYPDVAAVVDAGGCASGLAHFEAYGFDEGRSPSPTSRRKRILGNIDTAIMQGVEIGALANPIIRKEDGRILYVDFLDTQALIRNYASDPHTDTTKIVQVDAIWGADRLRDCLPSGFKADYVVASHVAEHVPDLLGWINEISDILNDTGQIRLALPDRRYTFDILRQESQIHDVLDAHLRKTRVPLPRAILDFLISFRTVSAKEAWLGQIDREALEPMYKINTAFEAASRVFETGVYQDTHCWVFTPRSFAKLMEQAVEAGLLRLGCVAFHDTKPFELEFFVGLQAVEDHHLAIKSWQNMRDSAAE